MQVLLCQRPVEDPFACFGGHSSVLESSTLTSEQQKRLSKLQKSQNVAQIFCLEDSVSAMKQWKVRRRSENLAPKQCRCQPCAQQL